MENREFVSAANLPTTEAEEVSVLCLENGELKQKPAKGLGGCPMPLFVCQITFKDFAPSEDDEWRDVELTYHGIPDGAFKVLKEKILGGEFVTVGIQTHYLYMNYEDTELLHEEYDNIVGYPFYCSVSQDGCPEYVSLPDTMESCLTADGNIIPLGKLIEMAGGGE